MNIHDFIIERVKKVVKDERKYQLPHFLLELRRAVGMSRRAIAEMLSVSESKLYYLELGKYTRPPEASFLNKLSSFYGISKTLMITKLNTFLESK